MPSSNATPKRALPLLPSLLLAALLGACAVQVPQPDGAAPVAIKLIALNDFHGNLLPPGDAFPLPDDPGQSEVPVPLGGAAFLATAVRSLQARNPLNVVVAAGDLIGASPLQSSLFHDEPSIAVLDEIGLKFSAVGNHEFDRGRVALLRMQRGGCAPDGTVGVDTCVSGISAPTSSMKRAARRCCRRRRSRNSPCRAAVCRCASASSA